MSWCEGCNASCRIARSLACVFNALWLGGDAHLGPTGVGEFRGGQRRTVVAHPPVGERSAQPARTNRTVGFACRLATCRAPHGGSLVAQMALRAPDPRSSLLAFGGFSGVRGRIPSHPLRGWFGRSPVKCSSTKGESSTPGSSRVGRVIPLPAAGSPGSSRRARYRAAGMDGPRGRCAPCSRTYRAARARSSRWSRPRRTLPPVTTDEAVLVHTHVGNGTTVGRVERQTISRARRAARHRDGVQAASRRPRSATRPLISRVPVRWVLSPPTTAGRRRA